MGGLVGGTSMWVGGCKSKGRNKKMQVGVVMVKECRSMASWGSTNMYGRGWTSTIESIQGEEDGVQERVTPSDNRPVSQQIFADEVMDGASCTKERLTGVGAYSFP